MDGSWSNSNRFFWSRKKVDKLFKDIRSFKKTPSWKRDRKKFLRVNDLFEICSCTCIGTSNYKNLVDASGCNCKGPRKRKDISRNIQGGKGRKTVLAGLREGYPRDFQEYPVDILLSGNLAPFFFLFSTDIHRNVLTLASTLNAS